MSHPTYQITLKLLLKKNDKYLFLRNQSGKKYDLPGGRIDKDELRLSLDKILKREVVEELGKDLEYKIGKPAMMFRRYFDNDELKVFVIVYEAEYISGEIKLSDEHSSMEWIEANKPELKKEDFFNEEEYQAFIDYI